MKHRKSLILIPLNALIILSIYNYVFPKAASAAEITVNAKLGESFTLSKGQSANITNATDKIVLEFNGFLKIPGRGIASGIFPSYRLFINGVVVENYAILPYDVDLTHDLNYELAVFTIWDSVQRCIQTKDGTLPNGLKAYNQDACWSKLAKRLSNIDYCEKIQRGKGRDACIEYLVDETDQQELCERVDTPLMFCKYTQVLNEKDPDKCGDIITWDHRNRCYKELANIQGSAICDNLKKPSEKETCRDAVRKKETEK